MKRRIVALVLALSMFAALGGSAAAERPAREYGPLNPAPCQCSPDVCHPDDNTDDPRRQNDRYHNPR